MNKKNKHYNAKNLIEELKKENLKTDKELEPFIIDSVNETKLPLYLRVLMIIASCIAAICLIFFIDPIRSKDGFVLGLFLITFAIIIENKKN